MSADVLTLEYFWHTSSWIYAPRSNVPLYPCGHYWELSLLCTGQLYNFSSLVHHIYREAFNFHIIVSCEHVFLQGGTHWVHCFLEFLKTQLWIRIFMGAIRSSNKALTEVLWVVLWLESYDFFWIMRVCHGNQRKIWPAEWLLFWVISV